MRLEVLLAATARILARLAGVVEFRLDVPLYIDGGCGDGRFKVGGMRIGGFPHLVTSCSTPEVASSFSKLLPSVVEEVELRSSPRVHEGFLAAVKAVGSAVADETDPFLGAKEFFFLFLL